MSHSVNDLRDYLVQVSYDTVVSNFEDRSIRILIDGNDDVGCLHSCQVLDSAGDTASKVDFRLNGSTRLSNLMRVIYPTGVYSRSR